MYKIFLIRLRIRIEHFYNLLTMKMKRKDSRDATVSGPNWSLQIFADSSLSYASFHFFECERNMLFLVQGSRKSESKMSKNLVFVVALDARDFLDSFWRLVDSHEMRLWWRKRRNSIRNGECPCCETRIRLSMRV